MSAYPFSNTASATVGALLSAIAASYAYFEKASVTHRMYFFPDAVVFSGPNRSMCTL